VEKERFFPIPCSTTSHVAIGHPICIVIMPHMTVIICHNCRLYRITVFFTIISFCGWIVNVCQGHMSFLSLHTTAIKLPMVLTRMSPHFNLSVLCLRSLGMPFLCSPAVPQQEMFYWAKSSNRSGVEKKLSMYSLWPNPSTTLLRLVTAV